MKKSISLFLIFIFLINVVYAGETYYLDFKKTNSYVIGLVEGDRVEFELNDILNTVLIKKINPGSTDIAIFTNIEDKDISLKIPLYSKIDQNKYVKLDLEKDGEPDLYVVYKNSNSTAASILFQLPASPNDNLEVFPKSQFSQGNILRNLLYLFLALLVVFVVLFFLFRKKTKETAEIIEKNQENKSEALHNK
jgi:hypothetical protein